MEICHKWFGRNKHIWIVVGFVKAFCLSSENKSSNGCSGRNRSLLGIDVTVLVSVMLYCGLIATRNQHSTVEWSYIHECTMWRAWRMHWLRVGLAMNAIRSLIKHQTALDFHQSDCTKIVCDEIVSKRKRSIDHSTKWFAFALTTREIGTQCKILNIQCTKCRASVFTMCVICLNMENRLPFLSSLDFENIWLGTIYSK